MGRIVARNMCGTRDIENSVHVFIMQLLGIHAAYKIIAHILFFSYSSLLYRPLP